MSAIDPIPRRLDYVLIRARFLTNMKRFCEFCTKAKVVVVELGSLIGFVVIVASGVYLDIHWFLVLLRK